ncbi:MAG: Stk1 family PASTA domain-containing Ser/Thr kinase [Nigerium sp.]|nr:Stk1 family PASTA domain-containing Ser/Thr kinase [Nigerium sp.]
MKDEQPRILGGRYELGQVIGRGGMALVSQARDLRLGRDVAIKELRIDLASDSTFQERFRREAQAAAKLNHPNIVSVYDTGEQIDPTSQTHVPFIVMELVEGLTLRDILREGRPILPRRALEFTVGVLDALSYSHRAGIVHRDIKPANVMLTSSGAIKVMDFGIARAVSDTSSTMTQTAAVIGTAQYLSPEQARGEKVDARSDIYSAGCLMYELLVGRPPFQGDSPVSVAYQHVREQPVPPSTLDAEITAPMDAVVLKALAKDPDDRYASAALMRDDVQRILGGQRVEATLPPPVPPLTTGGGAASAATMVMPADQTGDQTTATTTGTLPAVEEAPKSRARLWWTLSIVSLLVIGLIAGVAYFTNREMQPKQVVVPQGLMNATEQMATQILNEAKLLPEVVDERIDDATSVGRVTGVQPVAGTRVPEGSSVRITINRGLEKLTIPTGLATMRQAEAERLLDRAGFTNVKSVDATDEPASAAPGAVVSVSPAGGTQATATTPITLQIATGKSRFPVLIALTREQAEAEAQKAGFTNLTFEGPDTGQVIRTDPQGMTLVSRDTRVTIVLRDSTPSPTSTGRPDRSPSATPGASPSQTSGDERD